MGTGRRGDTVGRTEDEDRARRGGPRLAVASLLGLVVGLGFAASAEAQIAWDAPLAVHPYQVSGWTVWVADADPADFAVIGQWRGASGETDFGLRAGIGEDRFDDVSVFGGVDVTGPLLRQSDPAFGLDWVAGAGLGVSEDVLLSIPFGIVVGWDIPLESATLQPHAGPRVILDAWFGDDDSPGSGPGRDDDDVDLELAVDLGVDLVFDSGWTLRFAGTAGGREALAIGVGLPR